MHPVLREIARCHALYMGRLERSAQFGPDGRSPSGRAIDRGVMVLGGHIGSTGGSGPEIAGRLISGPSCDDPVSADAVSMGVGRVVQDGDPYWVLLWEER